MSEYIKLSINNESNISLIIDDERWNIIRNIKSVTEKAISEALAYVSYFEFVDICSFCIKLTDDEFLKKLNKDFRNKNQPTNILSFPNYELKNGNFASLKAEGKEVYLGDIAISFDRIYEEHRLQGKTFKNHYTHIIVHGILHLLGYDHEMDREAEIMENIEVNILKLLRISNPYETV